MPLKRTNARVTAADLNGKRNKTPEANVTEQCIGFLEAHGWRPVRMGRGKMVFGDRAVTFGEPGVTDWELIKYIPTSERGLCRLVWCEFKQSGSKRSGHTCTQPSKIKLGKRIRCTACDQRDWQERERARGALVVKVDTFEQLRTMEWWRE